jgi:phage/conjugal plasmid C-4 type zinc finger TraR family protein
MDVFDRATEAEELFRSQAIAAQAKKAPKAGNWDRLSARWCAGAHCGARIPDERRRAIPGVQLCAECQTEKEKRERQRR